MTAPSDPVAAQKPTPPRIARGGWLDALRFIVGAMIILYHFRGAAPVPLSQLHPVFDRGYLLTDFFIIDSGYVLARIYAGRLASGETTFAAYARQRFLRVVPAHLAVSLVLILIVATAMMIGVFPSNPQWFDWRELPAQVALVQAYGVPGGQGWNAPTWTLSALLGCYLCLPWVCRWMARVPPWLILMGGIGLLLAANTAAHALLDLPVYKMPMRYGFLRAAPLFLLGVAVALFAARVWIAPRTAAALGLAAAGLMVWVQALGSNSLLTLGLMTLVILCAGAIPVRHPSRLVEHLALMSFAMFLTNEVTRIVWFGMLEAAGLASWGAPARWTVWALGLVAAFIAAAIFRYAFDRPVQNWLNASRPGVPQTAASAGTEVAARV